MTTIAHDISNAGTSYGLDNKINDLVDAQIFRVMNNKVFDEEAENIVSIAKLENATEVIDFGCWVGILANEVLKRWPELTTYHMIDAVPYYINKAKELLQRTDLPCTEVTLIPNEFKGVIPTSILVHPYDTLNSSSIYSSYFLDEKIKAANVTMPCAPVKRVTEFVQANPQLFAGNQYVKLDLDGVDMDLVNSFIDQGHRPAVIQFEVWNAFKPGYDKLKEKLTKLGYMFPDVNIKVHQHFSVAVGKHNWWAVGYDNVTISPQSYYYKSWN